MKRHAYEPPMQHLEANYPYETPKQRLEAMDLYETAFNPYKFKHTAPQVGNVFRDVMAHNHPYRYRDNDDTIDMADGRVIDASTSYPLDDDVYRVPYYNPGALDETEKIIQTEQGDDVAAKAPELHKKDASYTQVSNVPEEVMPAVPYSGSMRHAATWANGQTIARPHRNFAMRPKHQANDLVKELTQYVRREIALIDTISNTPYHVDAGHKEVEDW